MTYSNSWHQGPWLGALAENRASSLHLRADGAWGMPVWLLVVVLLLLVLGGLAWYTLGSDLVRYLKIRRM